MIDVERASSLWSVAPLAALGGLVLVPGEGTQGLGGIKKSFTTELHPRALGITCACKRSHSDRSTPTSSCTSGLDLPCSLFSILGCVWLLDLSASASAEL